MKKILGFFCVMILLVSSSAPKDKRVSFDAQAAWDYIKALADDSMEGRRSGQRGGKMASEYIASKFKEWGLKPAGDGGSYFQNFTIEHRHIGEGVLFEIITGRERKLFDYRDDWRVQSYSGSGHFTAEVVFAGYGIHAPQQGYDDYASVDVKDRVVLFASGTPPKLEKKLGKAADMDSRVSAAQELGAKGVFVFQPPTSETRFFRMRLEKERYKPDFVILSVERSVVDFIFKDLPTEARVIFQEINRSGKPKSMRTGVKAFVVVNAIFDPKRATRNVVAMVPGTDKSLQDECVVIGGHMDHLGISPTGEVMNGANDNASGTAVVMEVARVMSMNRARPKRTVLFAAWAGEEQGLLGSRHFVDHPPMPIEKTVAYINMDMVGHGSGKIPFQGVYYAPEVWELLKQRLPKEILETVNPARGGPGGSDHTPFLMKGVPGFFIITRGAIKYHHSRDDSDLIRPEMLKKTGDFVLAAVEILANEPGNLIQPMRQETFYLKYQNLINHELPPLDKVIAAHGDAKDSHVDIQLAVIPGQETETPDQARLGILEALLDASESIKKTKGLSLYSPERRVSMTVRQGKTTVVPGVKGLEAFRDDPRWAGVMAKQGVYFATTEASEWLFGQEGLTEEGQKVIRVVTTSGLLLIASGTDAAQARALLEAAKKPLLLITQEVWPDDVLEMVKEKESAVGLLMGAEEEPAVYFKRLDALKEAVESSRVMVVNEQCLWSEKGKMQFLSLFSEIIKAKYERSDLSNIFSGTFLRLLRAVRDEGGRQVVPYIPF